MIIISLDFELKNTAHLLYTLSKDVEAVLKSFGHPVAETLQGSSKVRELALEYENVKLDYLFDPDTTDNMNMKHESDGPVVSE